MMPTLLATLLAASAVVSSEMIFEDPPHPSCHASTIAWTETGLVASWFGGTDEGEDDVGIWLSRHGADGWSSPLEVARDDEHPCWNPVLFLMDDGPLLLYYKVGPNPREWWGMVTESTDGGATWSSPRRLPEGILGPIKNKPVRLGGDVVLSGSSTEHDGWVVHMELSADGGRTWTKTGPLNDGASIAAIQPTILPHAEGGIQILCRTRQGRMSESRSVDRGLTWSPMVLGELPNPSAGFDAVLLEDGRSLLVYNHTTKGRHSLDLALSADGTAWERVLSLENQEGESSYPAIIQSPDGLVHITYTHRRRHIKHVVIDPRKLDPPH